MQTTIYIDDKKMIDFDKKLSEKHIKTGKKLSRNAAINQLIDMFIDDFTIIDKEGKLF